jgi:two-component system OmpR family response regulator
MRPRPGSSLFTRHCWSDPGPLSGRELEERIYGWGEEVESNAVEFVIHSLRRKLSAEVIRNVRGVGWMVPREA